MKTIFPLTLIPLILIALVIPVAAQWDYSKNSIPVEDIRGGGPPKDGIPALFDPEYIRAGEADKLLEPEEEVLGLVINGVPRAYPIRIMSWHELVNDEIAGTPYLVSW